MRRDRKCIQPAEAIKVGKVSNTITAIVGKEPSVVYVMNSIISHAGAFALQYSSSFADARINGFVDNFTFMGYIPTCIYSTNV